MAFIRTWQMSYNNLMDTASVSNCAKNVAWQLKAMMCGQVTLYNTSAAVVGSPAGLWTHYASSDATTAGIDATDRWLSTYTVGKLNQAANGSAHSWIILKSINSFGGVLGNLYYTIDLVPSLPAANFYLSKTAPTGGTTLTRPTAADEMSFTSVGLVNAGVSTAYAHGGVSASGDVFFGAAQATSGYFYFQNVISSLLDAKPYDVFPFAWLCAGATTQASGALGTSTLRGSQPSASQTRNSTNNFTINPTGCRWTNAAATTDGMASLIVTDPVTGNFPELPIYMFVSKLGFNTLKGRLPDITWAPDVLISGSYGPASAPTRVVMGNSWVPGYVNPIV